MILTTEYNLQCNYCFGEALKDVGGEPLLCVDEIKQIMDQVEAKHFLIQTNGSLLDRLEPRYVNRLHTILVSIDGDEALTDFYRGKGTFRKVIINCWNDCYGANRHLQTKKMASK